MMPCSGFFGLGHNHPHCNHAGVEPVKERVRSWWTLAVTGSGQPFTISYVSPVAPGAVLPLWCRMAAWNSGRDGGAAEP